jgi:5-carboxymethyl-2-hydroxymuconate isomerase
MPHFVIECSENVLKSISEEDVIEQVHLTANSTGLFDEGDIKVRIKSFEKYSVGNTKENFIHVFGHIMEGRTTAQKADLSKSIVEKLLSMFPDVPNIAINIGEFEKATYFNRKML